jgi:DNA (cytosine-5)-methyltransferase 1
VVVLKSGQLVHSKMANVDPTDMKSAEDLAERAYLRSSRRPRENHSGQTVRVFDLFSGCGGLTLGLWEACRALGKQCLPVAAIDNSTIALDIYHRNFPSARLIPDDARKVIDGEFDRRLTTQERSLAKEVGSVDFLVAGPPCQGFSSLNNHTRGSDPKNQLYLRVARAARVLEPAHLLIENVISVRTADGVIDRTLEELTSLGYIARQASICLSDIGVPQRRRRHVVVASKSTETNVAELIRAFLRTSRTVRWAIGDLAHADGTTNFDTPSKPSDENCRRMDYLFEESVFELPDRLRPECHRKGGHTYSSVYGRLRWEQPAQTITSGYGSMGQGRYVHPSRRRTLTPHEAARLQLFPDWFDFGPGPRTAWATSIGNAVPHKLSYVFALNLLS